MENRELIRVEMRDPGLLWVTLNTPPLNLQSLESMEQLEKILDYIERDTSIHALVLTGSGDHCNCRYTSNSSADQQSQSIRRCDEAKAHCNTNQDAYMKRIEANIF